MEEYHRDMSPPLLDITRLMPEEREIDILTEYEHRRALVSLITRELSPVHPSIISLSLLNVARLLRLDSFRKQLKPLLRFPMTRKLPVVRIWPPKLSIERKPRKISTRKKNYSISKKTLLIPRHTTGKTSTDLENPGTSIVSTPVTNGTSIIKRITSKDILSYSSNTF